MPPVLTGEANHKTKLTERDVEFILKSNKTIKELAEMFGVTPQAIRWRRKHGRLRS